MPDDQADNPRPEHTEHDRPEDSAISPEALEILRRAPVSPEFLKVGREFACGKEIIPRDIETAPIPPESGKQGRTTTSEEYWPTIEPPIMPRAEETRQDEPRETRHTREFTLTDLTLDLRSVGHMTPGLAALEGLSLGRLIFQMQGGDDIVFQQEGNGGGNGEDEDEDEGEGGETAVRDSDELEEAAPDKPLFSAKGAPCNPGVIASVELHKIGARKGAKPVETHNLRLGFDEIVVPYGHNAQIDFRPDADETLPYDGELTGVWETPDFKYTAKSFEDYEALAKGWKEKSKDREFSPKGRPLPFSSTHKIVATWISKKGVQCTKKKEFTVTFAQEIAAPPRLDLGGFYDGLGGFTGFPGTDKTTVFGPGPAASRNGSVVVPIVIYWVVEEKVNNCCGLISKAEIVQFARAVITGPNGHLGKGWTLDIRDDERKKKPGHDPTFTNKPGDDKDESPTAPGAGSGTRKAGNGLGQWDAPGMPKSLYDRLIAAQGPSSYRQQFLALLVCRPQDVHDAQLYLKTAKVRRFVVLTVVWAFPGKGGQPNVGAAWKSRELNCVKLKDFLEANGLLDEFDEPSEEARGLKILEQESHEKVSSDVDKWQRDPLGQVKVP